MNEAAVGATDYRIETTPSSELARARPKILYIAGWGRSGTTILANILGQFDGAVSVGELHYIWSRGFEPEWLCGCGDPVRECDYWSDVFELAFGGREALNRDEVLSAERGVRTRHLLKLWYACLRRSGGVYAIALAQLYGGIAARGDARVIVDSSKDPADAVVVASLADYDVYVVHLVRDPRAVAFSWSRRKEIPMRSGGPSLVDRVGWFRSTVTWLAYNLAIGTIVRSASRGRLLRVRYEDFVAEPVETVDKVTTFAGLRRDPSWCAPLASGRAVRLQPAHTVSGNPDRFKTGVVPIQLDDEWVRSMSRLKRLGTTIVAAPLMLWYGYPLRPQASANERVRGA